SGPVTRDELFDPIVVECVNRAGKAEVGRVGDRNRLVEIADAIQGRDWAEQFFLRQLVVERDVVENRRRDVVAVAQRLDRTAASQDARTTLHGGLDGSQNAIAALS